MVEADTLTSRRSRRDVSRLAGQTDELTDDLTTE
jgi:hypothetical protein